jgi:hypothetical protein
LAGIIKPGYPTAPHFIGMKRKTANIDIRVEPQVVKKIDPPIAQWSASKSSDDIDHKLYLQGLAVFLFHNALGQQGLLKLTIDA